MKTLPGAIAAGVFFALIVAGNIAFLGQDMPTWYYAGVTGSICYWIAKSERGEKT